MMLGRAAECAAIDELLVGARAGRSQVLVVRGDPGIGKTTLLEYAVGQATDMQVLSTRGYETESEIPFAGLADLLRPVLPLVPTLPGPQAAALQSALALGPPLAGDRFSVYAATVSILGAAAEQAPVLVAVDDLHWLDASSRDAILFAARRLTAEGIALLLASRNTDDGRAATGFRELSLSGLTRPEVEEFCHLVVPSAPPEVRQRLYEVTAGNPLALIELGDLWASHGLDEDEITPPALPGSRLERVLRRRLVELPGRTRQALLIAAAAGGAELHLTLHAAGIAGLELADFEPAEDADVVTIDSHRIEFRHPMQRSVVYYSSSMNARCRAHAALAQALAAMPGDAAADARAWHLAAATLVPDEEVASLVAAAAVRARDRAGYVAAARAFQHAARLSQGGERPRHLVRAARCWQLAGRPRQILPLLDEALPLAPDPRQRAPIQHMRAYVRMWSGRAGEGLRLLLEGAEQVAELDRSRAALMYADAGLAELMLGRPEQALSMAHRAFDVSREGDGAAQLVAAVALAGGLALRGRRAEAVRLLRDHSDQLELANPLARAQELAHAGLIWTWLDGYGEADRLLNRLIRTARRAGALGVLPQALGIASELHFRRGRWSDARACAAESVRLAEETGQVSVYALFFAARLAAVQGRVEECQRDCGRIVAAANRFGLDILSLYAGHALGLLALGSGHAEEAIQRLEAVRRLPVASGVRESAAVPWVFDLVEAYIRDGRKRAAEALLDEWAPADEETETWAHAASRRCRAMLAERDEMIDMFERALDSRACKDMPFERARTQLCYGERLRRHRQRSPARQQLRRALETLEQLQALPWAARAEAELRATGETLTRATGPAPHLTPQELQVALVVARGASNQEAAAELFLSRKTIEYHLSNVYRKTNAKSRAQLATLTAGAA